MDYAASPDADPPPPYSVSVSGDLLQTSPELRDDGRINIDLNSRVVKALSLLSGPQHSPARYDTGHSPFQTPEGPKDHGVQVVERESPEDSFPTRLNIVIQVVGSRGDVQPFIALGVELQRRHRHNVRLATHDVFEKMVRNAGLGFYPIGGDPAELMAYMVRNPGLIPSMKSLRAGEVRQKRVMMAEMLHGCWRSCIESEPGTDVPFVADAIIANPPSFAHVHCAQALGVPVHLMFTMPWTSTRAFPHPLVNIKLSETSGSAPEPTMANFISYGVVEFLTWQGLGDIINEWRESINLQAIPFYEGPRLTETLKIPFTYCWSPALVPKPQDWPSHIDICGFFFREPPAYTPPPELAKFIAAGRRPIYIGFGSIVIDDPKRTSQVILEAVRQTGCRALVSRGWSNLDGPETEDVMFLGDCPHEWLFQQVAAVIHHGGAGTTACGLRNGRPTMIVPFFGDQPFWGDMVAAAGAGPTPIPHKDLTVENLVEAIRFCLRPETEAAAQNIAATMSMESGVVKGQPAAWVHKRGKTYVRLSKAAAEILSSHLKVDYRSLTRNETRRLVIESHPRDPLSGTIFAAMSASGSFMRAVTNTVTVARPPRAFQREATIEADQASEPAVQERSLTASGTTPRANGRGCIDVTRSITASSASGLGTCLGRIATGAVSIPFAFTEGFRNLPLLYGGQVRDHGEIRDWKSGAAVGAKVVVYDVAEGVGGLVLLPYNGAREEGTIGAAKGVMKAVAGLSSKVFTATIGMATYPLQGIYQSVWTLANSGVRRSIETACRAEGRYLADRLRSEGLQDEMVMEAFDEFIKGQRS